jgi:hypothetical protein
MAKPLLERKKMFPKKVFLLQKFYKEENERQKISVEQRGKL